MRLAHLLVIPALCCGAVSFAASPDFRHARENGVPATAAADDSRGAVLLRPRDSRPEQAQQDSALTRPDHTAPDRVTAGPGAAPSVSLLLVSIDGLKPDYVTRADELGLRVPHLRALQAQGVHASGVRGVLPTSTYPSHTTLATGVSPARHGIVANQPFDPHGRQPYRWHWYAEDLRVATLWDVAAAAGHAVAAVSWPVTVGATSIRYNIPDFTGTRSDEDAKMIRAWAGREFMDALAAKAGPFLTDVNLGTKRDWARTRYLLGIIEQKRPSVVIAHFVASDHAQHKHGPFSPEAHDAIEEIDDMVGQLLAAMRQHFPQLAVCIVSDHGFSVVEHSFALDAALMRAGLRVPALADSARPAAPDWEVATWPAGGSAAVLLRERDDDACRARLRAALRALAAEPQNGIERILERDEIAALGGSSDADFWVDFRPGTRVSPIRAGRLVFAEGRTGTHGYVPTHPEMNSTFILTYPGVVARELGEIDMRAIAPTLAWLLGTALPDAELPPLTLPAPAWAGWRPKPIAE